MQRTLIVIGIMLILIGVLWPWVHRLPFGRLPGDIVIDRGGFRMYIPFMTMLLLSVLLSFVLWLIGKFR